MTRTSVVSDPVSATIGRASGYSGTRNLPQSQVDGTYGSTGILSTVGDLSLWAAQFYNSRAQHSDVFRAMQTPGILTDGIPITYASGVHVERFHGLPYIEHTGAVPGFRSDILIFPDQKLSVVLLANTDGFDPAALPFEVAGIYLKSKFRAPRQPMITVRRPTKAMLASYAGTYELVSGTSQRGPGRRVTFTTDGLTLRMSSESEALVPSDLNAFFSKASTFTVRFKKAPSQTAPIAAYFEDSSGTVFGARRLSDPGTSATEPVEPPITTLLGLYFSSDLRTSYRVRLTSTGLILETPRGELPTTRQSAGVYTLNGDASKGQIAGTIEFETIDTARPSFRLTMSGKRAAGIRFAKVGSISGDR